MPKDQPNNSALDQTLSILTGDLCDLIGDIEDGLEALHLIATGLGNPNAAPLGFICDSLYEKARSAADRANTLHDRFSDGASLVAPARNGGAE